MVDITFVGRQNELRRLEGLYSSGKFECVILHGRLRVGKTALLREFTQNKKAIHFTAQETNADENLRDLTGLINAFQAGADNHSEDIASYDDAFERISQLSSPERVIFIIDDYQYLVSAHRGISELIGSYIDRCFIKSRLMLIICGSSEPVMDNETLGFGSPFHGRRTAQIKLPPFTFFETKRYYSEYSAFDIAVVYGLTGGVPRYLELMDPGLSIEENIRSSFFDPASFLFEEPANILRREVRDPTYYNAVLRAIAAGCSKNSDIAVRVSLETSACTAYLKNLIALGIVGKHTPVTEKSGKKTAYTIADNMFRFWYRFVPDNMSYIQSGTADRIWRSVARDIPPFMGEVFEDICLQWMEQQNQSDRLPVKFVEIGRWWGVDPVWKRDTALPIVAYADDDNAIFGDCVWSDEPAQINALISLEERSHCFRYRNRFLFLFSRSGFSDECASAAQRINANLVMFE